MQNKEGFSFNISLSILNHLGRNLYRSFATVLGEAISNSWDADAKNVWIYIDKDANSFVIKDDGDGMSEADFRDKFLKVGYSKRGPDNSVMKSDTGRPFIGRKGIGKLALLSCAEKISVISKTKDTKYVGGTINNTALDDAITEDSTDYNLEEVDEKKFKKYTKEHGRGTIIYFEGIHEGVKNTLDYLKKIIALYFRFSLIDKSFNIYLNDEEITEKHLKELAEKTEFLWNINTLDDPYVDNELSALLESDLILLKNTDIQGFIASVERPRHLKIIATEEKAGIDLFVNGRLRERDILRHMPAYSTRHIASYVYGQIHLNSLDDQGADRFTSSREGIIESDPKYELLLETLREGVLEPISKIWDRWRLKHKKEGDPENTEILSTKERKVKTLVEETSKEYILPKGSKNAEKIGGWLDEIEDDARFNVFSYVDCFLSENLIRKYIQEKKMPLSREARSKAKEYREQEEVNKNNGNISIQIMEYDDDTNYLSMDDLANFRDKKDYFKFASLSRDAKEYKPMRNAVAHTARLTQVAKDRLSLVYENIKARIRKLLSEDEK